MSQRHHLIGTFALSFVGGLGVGMILIGIITAIPVRVATYTADAEGRMIPDRIIVQAPDVPHSVLPPVPVPPCGATSTRAVPEK